MGFAGEGKYDAHEFALAGFQALRRTQEQAGQFGLVAAVACGSKGPKEETFFPGSEAELRTLLALATELMLACVCRLCSQICS